MKCMTIRKDGGPESHVTGFFVVEIKHLFSIVLLHFYPGSRDAYHTHAFNAISWLLRGKLMETFAPAREVHTYVPSLRPIPTPRKPFHKVTSIGHSYAISFRGPWTKTWNELIPGKDYTFTLTNGRKVVGLERHANAMA